MCHLDIDEEFVDRCSRDRGGHGGFFIVVFSQIEQVFLAWFTFDAERPGEGVSAVLGDAGHRWLTAQGGYVDNQAVLEVFNTAGGVFDSGSPAPASTVEGSMLLEFSDCEHGTISYQLDGAEQQSVIPVRRIASDNVALCESLGF